MALGRPSGTSDEDCDVELRTLYLFQKCTFVEHLVQLPRLMMVNYKAPQKAMLYLPEKHL
jgi:hypothetical protein